MGGNQFEKIVCIVLDGLGVGELPDAAEYGDAGSNTLGNLAKAVGGLRLPRLERMGLANILPVEGLQPQAEPAAAYGKMAEKSPGKDTTTGHWEMAGLVLERPFPTFPQGFPRELIEEFERRIGRRTLGNVVASGTQIIQELGPEHERTGYPIVYTSADSVFQIAAHEEVIPVDQLYQMCRTAREMLKGELAVGRVIARPFVGVPGAYRRTARRHDYSLPPPGPTLLDRVKEAGLEVIGVGKIHDIFVGQGLTRSYPTSSNREGVERIVELLSDPGWRGFLMANLVDFDSLWGHRNDCAGYAGGLEEFDRELEEIEQRLGKEDILIITADHGCDPTTRSTDHSREYVPLIVYGSRVRNGAQLGVRSTFADLGATIAELWGLGPLEAGTSMTGILFKELQAASPI